MRRAKVTINKALRRLGYQITKANNIPMESMVYKTSHGTTTQRPDIAEYSTTIEPAEVPCQKEAYTYTLNDIISDGDKVLDVGCGLGYGMDIMSARASEVHGVDVDEKAVKYATKHAKSNNPKISQIKVYDGYNLPYKDNEFDVITCVDVLEHVEDYDRFIDELLRVSKRAVLISTPNRRPEYTNPDGTPKNYWHLREWIHQELDEIVRSHVNQLDWRFINGSFEGPFSITKKPKGDTLVLMPVLTK